MGARESGGNAHRLGWVLAHHDETVPAVVCHACDNPGCQNPAHLVIGTVTRNRLEYVARAGVPGSPLNNVRGALGRSRALREAARQHRGISEAMASGCHY
ncbi:hypothetical protein FD514_03755 [Cutibacterium acnes]|nr:HNH endonuclease [Cutibacterium acnes]REB14448.1 hypothetical protein COH13_03785 [Cutibacterium acnes]REB18277.1 hypothetical protein COH12_00590 [Cutibacterium acnes]TLG15184.1 hypothetical protein FD522_02250 [Cutibacterium acnes]TLG16767.1 hypothetical protein FD521_05480 [Cutibacterium acnes]TLG24461.1 hypothetical protein FD516_00595 [Cutibacterium acnes]